MRDCDAVAPGGTRYQIKSRRLTVHNQSRQLGAIRSLDVRNFDVLAVALFNQDFCVMRAALIPHEQVVALARRVDHTNSWRFMLYDSVWSLPGVEDVTQELQRTMAVLQHGANVEPMLATA